MQRWHIKPWWELSPCKTEKSRTAIRAAIFRAAEQGHDEVRETAMDYLELPLTRDGVMGGLEF